MKNAGVPLTPASFARLDVGVDDRAVLVRIDAGVELRGVEAELGRVLLQVGVAQPLLVGEQPVVVRPELPLLVGALPPPRPPAARTGWLGSG